MKTAFKRTGLTLASILVMASMFGGIAAASDDSAGNYSFVHVSEINVSAAMRADSGHEYIYWSNGPNGGTLHLTWAIDSTTRLLTSSSMYATASLGNWSWYKDVNSSTKLMDSKAYNGDLNNPTWLYKHNFIMFTGIQGGFLNQQKEFPYAGVNLNRYTGNADVFKSGHWLETTYSSQWSKLQTDALSTNTWWQYA